LVFEIEFTAITRHAKDRMITRQATPAAIAEGGEFIAEGKLVAFPTETVYGLGGDATNSRAVAAIFDAKGRPSFNPLICHVASLEAAQKLAEFSPAAIALAKSFWPGPLTLVLPKRADCPVADLATAGLDTIAIRIPDHPVAQALLKAAGKPIAAPSANRSGHVSATRAEHVAADLGEKVDLILDGGPTAHGLESTVLDLSGSAHFQTGDAPLLLRPGAVTAEQIEAVTGQLLWRAFDADETPLSPGQLASHYAPKAAVRLDATDVAPGEALLAFGTPVPPTAGLVINLSESGHLLEAAANLFAALRTLDASGAKTIAVMPIPEHGLGEAINDRLRRAAAPRS
jgi:L-threonylcarbamoyladenylate synthase